MSTNIIVRQDLEKIFNSGVNWDMFKNCTVLVTGANGFLPAYMVESLLYLNKVDPENNVRVVGLVRNADNARSRFLDYLDDPNLQFIVQDVSLRVDTNIKLDYIIHAASQASPKYYGTDPVGTLKANVLGTINMLELACENDIKSVLYFSSGEVYGEVPSESVPIKEDTFGYLNPINVRSCYGESKRMGENICVSYCHQYGVPAKIVRPFHTYGPGMKLDDGRVYADFIANILKEEDIMMHSDGSATRAFCYLSDATIGFFKVLLNGENGSAYNVGNPFEEHSILNLAEIIVGLYPEMGLSVKRIIKEDQNGYLKSPLKRNSPNIDKASALNWKPVVSAVEGFKRTIESFKIEL